MRTYALALAASACTTACFVPPDGTDETQAEGATEPRTPSAGSTSTGSPDDEGSSGGPANDRGEEVWSAMHPFPENDWGTDIAVGPDGVYVCGTEDRDAGGAARSGIVIKYDFDGDELWTVRPIPAQESYCRGIVVSSDGNPVLAGMAWNNRWDAHVAKLDATDGQDVWIRGYARIHDRYYSIAIASNDDIVAVGATTIDGQNDFLAERYDRTGELLWTSAPDFTVDDGVWGAAVVLSGDVYISGIADDTAGTLSGALYRLDGTTGNPVWFDVQNQGGTIDHLADVAIDPNDGQAIVVGHDHETGSITLRKYGQNGDITWTQTYAGGLGGHHHQDIRGGLTIDDDGTVYFTGTANNATPDIWIRAFGPVDGDAQWTQVYDPQGGGFDYGRSIAVTEDALYVVGESGPRDDADLFVARLRK